MKIMKRKFISISGISRSKGKCTYTLDNGRIFTDKKELNEYLSKHNTTQFKDIKDPIISRLIQEILAHRNDYGDVIESALKHDTIKRLQDILKQAIFESECVYQRFTFKFDIKHHLYLGDYAPNVVDMTCFDRNYSEALVNTIKEILSEKYFYDYWEVGKDEFSLFFGIHKSVYEEKMKLIREWAEPYKDIIYIPERKID